MTQRMVPSGSPNFENRLDFREFAGKLAVGGFNSVGHVAAAHTGGDETTGLTSSAIGTAFYDVRMSIGSASESFVKDLIDVVEQSGQRLTHYWHPQSVGETGQITRTELQNLFSYLATERDNGNINVVTPTFRWMMVADSRDHNLVSGHSFEVGSAQLSDSQNTSPIWYRDCTNVVINTSTARKGTNSLEIPANDAVYYNSLLPEWTDHMVVEGYIRAKPVGGFNGYICHAEHPAAYLDYTDGIGRVGLSAGDTWTKFKVATGAYKSRNSLRYKFLNNGTDRLLLDDVYICPV